MHYSVHGHTAAEIIYERADAEKDFKGLTTWSVTMPTKPEADIEYSDCKSVLYLI